MCDTMVALGNATQDGSVIFAKNSDREPNEAHEIIIIPRAFHEPGSQVRCTYIELPQVEQTHAVLLAKPFWIWGAEMGANEHGVVIGNEAVFTKVPYDKEPGLIGMDFIRLALERAATARSALDTITSLLETYGQGGSCGFTHPFFYHNSFIIADPAEAWVLETAGKQWAAEKVKDVRSISNAITIGETWDLASADLVNFAVERGWCKNPAEFNFARCYSDFLYTRFSDAHSRQRRSQELLQTYCRRPGTAESPRSAQLKSEGVTVRSMMRTLRDHGPETDPYAPWKGITGADVCMHSGFGPVRNSQSTGSMVSHLTPEHQTHWLTGTSAPCTGVFKPVWIDSGIPDRGPAPTGKYNEAALWWRHEALHREVLRDFGHRLDLYAGERDEIEQHFIHGADECEKKSSEERRAFSEQCFTQSDQALERWKAQVKSKPLTRRAPWLYRMAWNQFNRQAGYFK